MFCVRWMRGRRVRERVWLGVSCACEFFMTRCTGADELYISISECIMPIFYHSFTACVLPALCLQSAATMYALNVKGRAGRRTQRR